jgi:hypothetical protein
MIMRFRGDGVGHTSTRAATKVFIVDRDVLDIKSPSAGDSSIIEEQNEEDTIDIIPEDLEAEIDEGELSESEMFDYGYEPECESEEEADSEEEREDGEGGEEDDTTIDELVVLGYADY